MASIMTNASALTALQSLNSTNKNLEVTQSRISTGYRVAEASDNAAYWSIATTMRSDQKAMSTVQDSLGLGASKVDTAYTGMNKAIETVNEIKVKLVAANGASAADKEKYDIEIKALQGQLKSYADAATFSGANWLSTDTTGHTTAGTFTDVKIVASFNRNAAGSVSLGTIDVKVQDIKLYDAYALATGLNDGILDATRIGATGARSGAAPQDPTAGAAPVAGDTYTVATLSVAAHSDAQITQQLTVVEAALKEMTTAATNLGAAKSRIDLQKTFTSSLMDSVERGVGQLVDADMNKESTRLQALQVQQQLGIQALSIANGNSQSILSLFRG
ncbi:flagellin N-terminal helical domain-containing protein [Mesorhizobium sp. 10J20-29]